MIKEALQYIVGLNKPELTEIGGSTFSDKKLIEVEAQRRFPNTLKLSTLTSFVDYINQNVDGIDLREAIIHVNDYKTVSLFTSLDEFQERKQYLKAVSITPEFVFDYFCEKDSFMISLQTMFCATPERAEILRILGTIKEKDIKTSSDDGVTQSVTTKKGIQLGENETLPNPVSLAPFRTFVEIEQPISEFVLRLKDDQFKGIVAGLFEADGGIWKLEAVDRIKNYLQKGILDESIKVLA